MTESAKHDDIAKEEPVTLTGAESREKPAEKIDDIDPANQRTQEDDDYRASVQEHNLKVLRQFNSLRIVIGGSACVLPWVALTVVGYAIMSGCAFAKLHPAAQVALISGSFLAVISLNGVVLHRIFSLAQNKPQYDMSKNLQEDYPVPPPSREGGLSPSEMSPEEWAKRCMDAVSGKMTEMMSGKPPRE